MDIETNDLLETLLRDVGAVSSAANPQPWYPADYVIRTGGSRAQVEAALDRLRLGGLLRLTDWVQGKGQGYALTPEGVQVIENAKLVQRLRQHGVEPRPAPPPLRRTEVPASPWERGEAIRNALFHSGRPVVTLLLIAVNVLVFLVGAYLVRLEDPGLVGSYLEGGGGAQVAEVRFQLGALTRARVIYADEWWRLLGYAFVHGSAFHLLMNMISLWMLGRFTEAVFGPVRYLALYLVSALGGGCAVVLGAVNGGPEALTVGASGGVCGLLAAAGTWVFLTRSHLPRDFVSNFFRIFTTNVILVIFISMMPHVSQLGHLGGAVGGGVIAVPLVYNRFGVGWKRWLGLAGAVAVPVVCVALVAFSITDHERANRVKSILIQVQERAFATKEQYLAVLVEKGQERLGSADWTAKAKEAVAQVQERLNAATRQLDRISFADPRFQDSLNIAKEYVSAWVQYYGEASNILDRHAITAEDRTKLEQHYDQSQTLTRRLNESPLLSEKAQ